MREAPSLKAKVLDTLRPGEQVRADFLRDGWFALFPVDATMRDEKRAMGYAKAAYLKPVGAWGEFRVPKGGMLNIRQGRTPSSEHVRTLHQGDVVKVDFLKDNWVAVFEPSETVRSESRAIGYSNVNYLVPASKKQIDEALAATRARSEPQVASSKTAVAEPEPALLPDSGMPEPKAEAEVVSSPSHWGRLVSLTRAVQVHAGRTSDSKVVATLQPGQAVRVDFAVKGWVAVFKPGAMSRNEAEALGYVYEQMLEADLAPLPEASALNPERAERVEEKTAETQAKPGPKPVDGLPLYQARVKVAEVPSSAVDSAESHEVKESAVASEVRQQAAEKADIGETRGSASQMQPVETAAQTRPFRRLGDIPPADEPHKGPVPVADQERHGFRYAVLDRLETRSGRIPRVLIRIYLDVNVIPKDEALSDFCATIWKEEWRQGSELEVDVFLPGMDLKDLSYVEALYDGRGLKQFWTREATLYGTRFKR
ncbi:MAG: hypothetical protein V3573_11865 [Desulfovibrionaceae bacterium]